MDELAVRQLIVNQSWEELRKRGIDLIELDLSEFAKGGGGPTCLTLPFGPRLGGKTRSPRETNLPYCFSSVHVEAGMWSLVGKALTRGLGRSTFRWEYEK